MRNACCFAGVSKGIYCAWPADTKEGARWGRINRGLVIVVVVLAIILLIVLLLPFVT